MRLSWVIIFLVLWGLTVGAEAYRIGKPQVFSLPWSQDQMNGLNDTLDRIWNLQQGEFNFDIVAVSKTKADNGDMWFIQTGPNVRLQFKANDRVYTIDAY